MNREATPTQLHIFRMMRARKAEKSELINCKRYQSSYGRFDDSTQKLKDLIDTLEEVDESLQK